MFTRDVSLNQYEISRINKELEDTQIEACLYNDDSVLWGVICDRPQYIQLIKDELKGIDGQMIEDVLPGERMFNARTSYARNQNFNKE